MKRPDPAYFTDINPHSKIIFTGAQTQGQGLKQETFFANYNDECFVLADGTDLTPHGDTAAALAVETAIWGYKEIRLRPYYWIDKKLFLKRIFRTVNIRVWQKRREDGFSEGLSASLTVLIIGPRNFFAGSVGDSCAFFSHAGVTKKITHDDLDKAGNFTKIVGAERFGLVPQTIIDRFVAGDALLLVNSGVSKYINEQELDEMLRTCGNTNESLCQTVEKIFATAQSKGSIDNVTAVLVKRIYIKRI